MNVGVVGSGKDGETDDNGDGTNHSRRQSSLGRSDTTVLVGNTTVPAVLVEDDVGECDDHAYQNTKESKTTDSWAPSSTLLEDDGESAEKRVEHTIDDGNVDGEESNDGLVDEKQPRTAKSDLKLGLESSVASLVELADVVVTSDLCELLSAPSQKNGSVSLRHGDSTENRDDGGKDGKESDEPLPSSALAEEATSDGTKSRTEERSTGKDGHGETTLLCVEHVSESTASVNEWTRAEEASEESEDDERSHVG